MLADGVLLNRCKLLEEGPDRSRHDKIFSLACFVTRQPRCSNLLCRSGNFRLLNIKDITDAVTYASLPEITATGVCGLGVYTATLVVNLRDQVRFNDSVPLQFKYEVADCRFFYAVSNIYNMSRLWRDTVTAAFNDKSACVEGSTGYSNSTKAAPESDVKVQYSVNLDWEEPDAALIPYDLDLSGGPYASLLGAKSNTVTVCDSGNICGNSVDKVCETVALHPCKNLAAPVVNGLACVPRVAQSLWYSCSLGTQWIPITTSVSRFNPGKASKNSAGSGASSSTSRGGYYPTTHFRDMRLALAVKHNHSEKKSTFLTAALRHA